MRLLPAHQRLAAWADSRVLPSLLVVILAVDIGVGLNWLLASPADLISPAYREAKMLAGMDVWGALFLAAGAAAGAAVLAAGRGVAGYTVLLPAALWGLWTVLYTVAASQQGVSWIGPVFACSLWLLHLLAGLAYSHHLAPPVTVGR